QAGQYLDLVEKFGAAYQNARAPGTRCKALTAAKDAAKAQVLRSARSMRAMVQATREIPECDKVLVDARSKKKTRTRVAAPARPPVLSVGHSVGYRPTLFLKDPEFPNRIAKPRGTDGAIVVYHVGENYPPDPRDWGLHGQVSRTRATLNLPAHLAPGTKVWVMARWYTEAGKHSPWSAPVSTHIGHGEQPLMKLAA